MGKKGVKQSLPKSFRARKLDTPPKRMRRSRFYNCPVTVSGCVVFKDHSIRIVNRTVEGEGRNIYDCSSEALRMRRDQGRPFIGMTVLVTVFDGREDTHHRVAVELDKKRNCVACLRIGDYGDLIPVTV